MTDEVNINGKILFYESNEEHIAQLKKFFTKNNLIGWKAKNFDCMVDIIKTKADLGAVFLCEESDEDGGRFIETAITIHNLRPELPIVLKRKEKNTLDDLHEHEQNAISAVYLQDDIQELQALIDKYLFNIYYPAALIRGIETLSEDVLKMTLSDVDIFTCTPYIIKDSFIFGELFSMIPLESSWCRGYMLIQVEKEKFKQLIQSGRTPFQVSDTSAKALNGLLGEITNMIWGSFKSKFFTAVSPNEKILSQVPVIVDQDSKYISFGADNPQLCFRYVIHDEQDTIPPTSMYQKFIFHLNWSPEEFKEKEESIEDFIEAGELEFF